MKNVKYINDIRKKERPRGHRIKRLRWRKKERNGGQKEGPNGLKFDKETKGRVIFLRGVTLFSLPSSGNKLLEI